MLIALILIIATLVYFMLMVYAVGNIIAFNRAEKERKILSERARKMNKEFWEEIYKIEPQGEENDR